MMLHAMRERKREGEMLTSHLFFNGEIDCVMNRGISYEKHELTLYCTQRTAFFLCTRNKINNCDTPNDLFLPFAYEDYAPSPFSSAKRTLLCFSNDDIRGA